MGHRFQPMAAVLGLTAFLSESCGYSSHQRHRFGEVDLLQQSSFSEKVVLRAEHVFILFSVEHCPRCPEMKKVIERAANYCTERELPASYIFFAYQSFSGPDEFVQSRLMRGPRYIFPTVIEFQQGSEIAKYEGFDEVVKKRLEGRLEEIIGK